MTESTVIATATEKVIPKRLVIKEAIEAGGATKESLIALTGCSSASLATNFTYLRLMGFYPVKAEDNTFSFVTEEDWEEIQADRKANATVRKTTAPKSPAEILEAAKKRMDRCAKALESALVKADQFDNEVADLRLTIARSENRLAELALIDAQAGITETEVTVSTDEDTHIDTDDSDLV